MRLKNVFSHSSQYVCTVLDITAAFNQSRYGTTTSKTIIMQFEVLLQFFFFLVEERLYILLI